MNITEFLLARIEEDETTAKAANNSGGGDWWRSLEIWPKIGPNIYDLPDADHIAHHSPARVHSPDYWAAPMDEVLEHLAAIYSNHPDYLEEWRP